MGGAGPLAEVGYRPHRPGHLFVGVPGLRGRPGSLFVSERRNRTSEMFDGGRKLGESVVADGRLVVVGPEEGARGARRQDRGVRMIDGFCVHKESLLKSMIVRQPSKSTGQPSRAIQPQRRATGRAS